MKEIKLFFKLVLIITLFTQTIQAQENAKGIKDQGIKTHTHQRGCCQYKVIYVGGGFNNPTGSNSQKLFGNNSGKTTGFTIDYSQTIVRKSGFSFGFNVGGNFFTGNGNPFGSTLPKPYLVTAQISSEVTGTSDTKNSGYFVGLGPQFNIHFANRFVFSPIFQIGYLGVTQSEFKAKQTTLMQGFALPNYTRTYDLISQTETKTSGLGFIPKARLSYRISKNIGIWSEASYLLGPTVKSEITTFKPAQDPNAPPPNSYLIQQMDAGTYTKVNNESKYNTLGFNAGLSFAFGGKKSAEAIPQISKNPKSCYTTANLMVDKFSCCNDTLVLKGHFDINKTVNSVVDNISITKVTDSNGNIVKNSLVLPSIIKSNGVKRGSDYVFEFKIDGKTCKKDLIFEYVVITTCTTNGIKESTENKETKTILEKDIPCCNCDKSKEIGGDSSERNIHNYPDGGHAVVGNDNTRKKACFAEATLITTKFKCCENQILIEGFFDVYAATNTVVNNVTITKVTDNKGVAITNTLILPFKVNPKGISKGYKFPLEFKIANNACKKDIIIEYVVNATCTTNKIEKSVQYSNTKTILEKELPCCGCDSEGSSDTSEEKCENNPIVNGDFLETGIISGTMPTGKLPKWEKAYGSPKAVALQGCLDTGYVELSGNKLSGSAISQKLDSKIISGKKYKVTVAVKYNKQQLDYGKIRVVAYNGVLPIGNSHPIPQADIAIIGRSPQVHDCGDWAFIEFPIWKANKDFDNIAINAFTNEDAISSTVLIDNISFCETLESECQELEVDASGNPIVPINLGTIPSNFTCTTYDDEDDYFNGNLTDLYGYNGTFDMYEQNFSETSDQCFNIGGDEIPDEKPIDCDQELLDAGITETCAEIETLIDSISNIPQLIHNYSLIPPLTSSSCNADNSTMVNNLKEQMAYGGKDIIYVHGLMTNNLTDRAKGVAGAMADWPNKTEFEDGGYYNEIADANWDEHIQHFLTGKGKKNRYLKVSYNCSQDAETAANSIASQIRDAMESGKGVNMDFADLRFTEGPNKERIAKCFGKEYIIISHSTGGLVANIMLSLANKTKTIGSIERIKYGNLSYLSDRCKGHIAMHSAISGSNLAAVAVGLVPKVTNLLQNLGTVDGQLLVTAITALANPFIKKNLNASYINNTITNLNTWVPNLNKFINSSIMVDLSPKITYSRWGNVINDISVPVLTVSGNHPTGLEEYPLTKKILKGLDDGVVNTESSSGRNQVNPKDFSAITVILKKRMFDKGLPPIRATKFYKQEHRILNTFFANSSPFISVTGMVYPPSLKSINAQFNNHYTFLQASDQHMLSYSTGFNGNYPETKKEFSINYEEELVTNDLNLYNNGIINPLIRKEMGEFLKYKDRFYPKLTWKKNKLGIRFPKIIWKRFYIWKRTYHRLKDNNLYDMDYTYNYLFPN